MPRAVEIRLLIDLAIEVEKLEVAAFPDALGVEGLLAALVGAQVDRGDQGAAGTEGAGAGRVLVVELGEVEHEVGGDRVVRGVQHVHAAGEVAPGVKRRERR